MMKDIKELIAQKLKKKEIMGDQKKKAHEEMIDSLGSMADEAMKDDLHKHKMEKVTVMAKDKEGLKSGLEKAEDILENMPGSKTDEEMTEDMDSDMEEVAEDEVARKMFEDEKDQKVEEMMPEAKDSMTQMSREEIDAEIERLMKLKEQSRVK